ncbi:MAG TPA: hypothetical protein VNI02_21700 [Blastocatellia bacterium]|jgi:hypothetical protein|nr:hypothetical protein [Blastocatellia bacterium]
MITIPADIVWPALFLEQRLLSLWIILAGLIIEYFFVWRVTELGAKRSILADVAMNAASTLLGLILIPAFGLVVAIFPGEFVGTFSPVTWGFTFLVAVFLNALIEFFVLRKGFNQSIGKKGFWWIWLANALSVGIAFGSFLLYPIKE